MDWAVSKNEITRVEMGVQDAYQRGYHDFNFFAGIALPDVCKYPFPDFYIFCWQLLIARDDLTIGVLLRFALGLPRGHAKTTFIKILLSWMIAYNKASFFLVVCATDELAEAIIQDIEAILSSPQMEAIYGAWHANILTGRLDLKRCFYQDRIVTLRARGAESSLRGINIDNKRPEVILCDDMQTKENDDSPVQRLKLLRWALGTLFKTIENSGDRLIIYIGNMYSDDCLLMQFKRNPYWISFITGAILENGEPLWPELHSLESLLESYEHDSSLHQEDIWFAEVMNDPISAATSLVKGEIPIPPQDYVEAIADGAFLTIDPSGFRKTSDDNVIVAHQVKGGKGCVSQIKAGNYNPREVVEIALTMAIEEGATLIAVETVGYQQSLQFWFQHFIKELGIEGIEVVELKPKGRKKESRIRLFVSELETGEYYLLNPAVRSTFLWQAMAYKLGKVDNKDDILDACAYGLDVRNEYWHLVARLDSQNLLGSGTFPSVRADNTPF